jgi:hypothetical protein
VFADHASEKHLFELLKLIKDELDTNPKYRTKPKLGKKPAKQNCVWRKFNEDDLQIYFLLKQKQTKIY